MTDSCKFSFDYYLEYAVMEHRDYLCDENELMLTNFVFNMSCVPR